MMLTHEVTMRLIEGETEINIRIRDERTAINFGPRLRAHLVSLGIDHRWPNLTIRLAPEMVVISTRPRVENDQGVTPGKDGGSDS